MILPELLMKKHQRSFVSLLTALSFIVLAVTGILAFARPFSIGVVGLHALTMLQGLGINAERHGDSTGVVKELQA